MGEVTEVALHSKMWTACLKDYSVCMSRPVVNQLRRGLLSIMDNKSCVKPKYPLVCVCVCVCAIHLSTHLGVVQGERLLNVSKRYKKKHVFICCTSL